MDNQTQYDEEITALSVRIKYKEEELRNLKEKAKELRFKAICTILGVQIGSVVDFVFKSGRTVAFKLLESDSEGNAEFYVVKSLPNFLGERTVFLEPLQRGLYNGIDNPKIIVH